MEKCIFLWYFDRVLGDFWAKFQRDTLPHNQGDLQWDFMDDKSEHEPESNDFSDDSDGNDMDFVIPNHQHFVNLWGIEIGKEGQREVGGAALK